LGEEGRVPSNKGKPVLYISGDKNPWYGKKLPAEVRIKISQSRFALFNSRRKRAAAISIDNNTTTA
jgi:hypothetical protein